MVISGLFVGIWGLLMFMKNEPVVKEEIQDHDDNRSKNESTGGEDEVVGKGEMEGGRNIEGKIVERGEKTEKLGEARGDGDGEHGVPDEEPDY